MTYLIRVAVLRARDLAAKDRGGTSDPFCILAIGNARAKTVVIQKDLNPVWNQEFDFGPFEELPTSLTLVCWDKDRFKNDFLGHLEIPVADLFYFTPSSGSDAVVGPTAPPTSCSNSSSTPSSTSSSQSSIPTLSLPETFSNSNSASSSTPVPALVPQPIRFSDAKETWYTLQERRVKGSISGAVCLKIGFIQSEPAPTPTDATQTIPILDISQSVTETRRPRLYRKAYDTLLQKTKKLRLYATESSANDLNDEDDRQMFTPHKRSSVQADIDESLPHPEVFVTAPSATISAVPSPRVVSKSEGSRPETPRPYKTGDEPLAISMNSSDFVGLINMEIVSVTDLPRLKNVVKTAFNSDPFVIVTFGKLTFKTRSIPRNLNPVFNERLFFNVSRSETNYSVRFSVYDHDRFSNHDHLGTITVPVAQLMETSDTDTSTTFTFPLTTTLPNITTHPQITFTCRFTRYPHLRRQFWIALSRSFDNDLNNNLNRIEIESLLDSINSTLSDSSVDAIFEKYNKDPDLDELTIDEFVDAIEDRMGRPPTPPDVSSQRTLMPNPLDVPPNIGSGSHHERIVSIKQCPVCHRTNLANRDDIDVISHIAVCSSEDRSELGRILMGNVGTEAKAQRKWYAALAGYMGYGKWEIGRNNANIIVQERATGLLIEEKMPVYIKLGIRLLYKTMGSRSRVESKRIRRMLKSLSIKQGNKYNDPLSAREIPTFIRFHGLNVDDILDPLDSFKNFNQFFYRRLKPSARPIASLDDPRVAVSPADCRCMVFPTVDEATRLWIKGTQFSIRKLLNPNATMEGELMTTATHADSSGLAKEFDGGSLAIFRLAPQDYHRFHVPLEGVFSPPTHIDGEYYTVNPMAIRSPLDVYGENKRSFSIIDSPQFGKVAYICIGAMMVGSIILTSPPGKPLARGDDHGYFAFGGSTILLIFQPSRIKFDEDLLKNSAKCLETLIVVGNSIGIATEVNDDKLNSAGCDGEK